MLHLLFQPIIVKRNCSRSIPAYYQMIIIYKIPKKHSSATNLISRDRSAMPRKKRTVATLAFMAAQKHRHGSADITEISTHPSIYMASELLVESGSDILDTVQHN